MRHAIWLLAAGLALSACSTRTSGVPYPGDSTGDVVVVGGEERQREGTTARHPGRIPPGHYPPPGECRIWYSNRPPGQQPPPARCESLVGRLPLGAFLLYHDRAWDTQYDWRRHERERPGSVPDIVLRIMAALARD